MATERKRIPNRDRKPLTSERLRQLLRYDPASGAFTRVGSSRPQTAHYITKPVGCIKPGPLGGGGGYLMINVDGKPYRAHRLAWLYMTGEWPTNDVDHKDRDRANNRWANLRAATRSQNIHNMGMRERNTSGVKGASYDSSRGLWMSRIVVNGRLIHLGRFATKEEAGLAYEAAAAKHFGEFARAA